LNLVPEGGGEEEVTKGAWTEMGHKEEEVNEKFIESGARKRADSKKEASG